MVCLYGVTVVSFLLGVEYYVRGKNKMYAFIAVDNDLAYEYTACLEYTTLSYCLSVL